MTDHPTDGASQAPNALNDLLAEPRIRERLADAIPRLLDMLERKSESERRAAFWTALIGAAWRLAVILGVVGVVFALVWSGKMAAESAAFVLGTVVGASFSFVGEWFGRGE